MSSLKQSLDDVIYLIRETSTTNDMGDVIKLTDERMVFANKKSIRQSEFYQAQTSGLKPELTFEIYSFEYDDEPKVKYNGKNYTIIRTFETGEILELIVEGVVNNGTS